MPITLTNTLTVNSGVTVLESNTAAVCSYLEIDFLGNSVRLFFRDGNVANNIFTPATVVSAVTVVTINFKTGAWTSTNNLSGTISGAALTSLQTTLAGLANSAETFAVNQNVFAGIQVPYTAATI